MKGGNSMLINEPIEMKWSNRNKKYYIEKGYNFTTYSDSFLVMPVDLTSNNSTKVKVMCDYCNEVYYPTFCNYLKCREKSLVKKDCCKPCSPLKHKEVCLMVYGVESTNQLKHVKEKKRNKLSLDSEVVNQEFINRGYSMVGEYINANTPINYLCPKHGLKQISFAHLKSVKGCKDCAIERISGENHYNWNGGITKLNVHLRDRLRDWTFESLKRANFRCELSGQKGDLEVHHLYNFSKIVKDTLNNLNVKISNRVVEFSNEELSLITAECLRLHSELGFGVVLTRSLHKEFHSIYGRYSNTPEQFYEFKSNYENKLTNTVLT